MGECNVANFVDFPNAVQICVQAMFTVKKMFKQSLRDEYTLPKIRNNYKGQVDVRY